MVCIISFSFSVAGFPYVFRSTIVWLRGMWEDSLPFSLSDIRDIGLGPQYSKRAEATSSQLQNLPLPHVLVSFICYYIYLSDCGRQSGISKTEPFQANSDHASLKASAAMCIRSALF
jgi:hypothetical protein